jgi:hypothetical protein
MQSITQKYFLFLYIQFFSYFFFDTIIIAAFFYFKGGIDCYIMRNCNCNRLHLGVRLFLVKFRTKKIQLLFGNCISYLISIETAMNKFSSYKNEKAVPDDQI